MNATLARKLRFSDVAYAVKATPKSLRLWLQRGLVDIHTPRQESGWAEYSFIDIAILALVRTFVNYGVDVPSASRFANRFLDEFPGMLQLKDPDKMPAGTLAMLWSGTRARLYLRDEETWQLEWSPTYDPLPEPSHTYLVIDVEKLFREAFERANESVNEGFDED